MLKSKLNGDITLPDFPDDDNTVTTTVTKSRRVSFGTNFVKEFIVGSAVSAQCMSEYEQAFPSSDSSNADSSHSIVESAVLNHSAFVSHETQKVLKPIPPPPQLPEPDSAKNRSKAGKFSSTICFSSDSPTADMEFTEGCLTLAKSILDKKNKEMTVIIQAKSKEGDKISEKENLKVEETKYFDGSEFEMSMTRCLKQKESSKREESRFEMERTNIFGGNEDESDSSWEESWDGLPLNLMMNHLDKDPEKVMKSLQASLDDGVFKTPLIPKTAAEIFPNIDTNMSGESLGDMSLTFENGKIVSDLSFTNKTKTLESNDTKVVETHQDDMEVETMDKTTSLVKNQSEANVEDLNKTKTLQTTEGDQLKLANTTGDHAKVEASDKTMILEKNESKVVEPIEMEMEIENMNFLTVEKEQSKLKNTSSDDMEMEVENKNVTVEEQQSEPKDTSSDDVGNKTLIVEKEQLKPKDTVEMEVVKTLEALETDQSKIDNVDQAKSTENDDSKMVEVNDSMDLEDQLKPTEMVDNAMEIDDMEVTNAPEKDQPDVVDQVCIEPEVSDKTKLLEKNESLHVETNDLEIENAPKNDQSGVLDESNASMKIDDMDLCKPSEKNLSIDAEIANDKIEETLEESLSGKVTKTNEAMNTEDIEKTKATETANEVINLKVVEETKTLGNDQSDLVEMEVREESPNKSKDTLDVNVLENKTSPKTKKGQSRMEAMGKSKALKSVQSECLKKINDYMEIETSTNEPDVPTEPALVDVKVIENLSEQSEEPNCLWSLEQVQHPQRRTPGFLTINCSLLQSIMRIQFSLEMSNKEGLDACSYVRTASVVLAEDEQPRTPEYFQVLEFGFEHFKKYFDTRRPQLRTIRDLSYVLDQINAFTFKMNSFLQQILTVLTCYPGSQLNESLLSFRLFSFPIFFSCTLSIDLSNLHRLSSSSLSFRSDFGNFNQNKFREIFKDSIKLENCLCEFIIRATRYLFDIEKKAGVVSKRRHIRLLPEELRL